MHDPMIKVEIDYNLDKCCNAYDVKLGFMVLGANFWSSWVLILVFLCVFVFACIKVAPYDSD